MNNQKKSRGQVPRFQNCFFALYDSTVFVVIVVVVSPRWTNDDDVETVRVAVHEDKPNKMPKAVAIAPTI